MKGASADTPASSSKPAAPRSTGRRGKVAIACESCRRKKVKCDGGRPACSSCRTKSKVQARLGSCSYQGIAAAPAETATDPSSQNRYSVSHDDVSRSPDPLSFEASASEDCGPDPPGPTTGRFARDINAAVTTKLGPPSAERPTLPHAADVPLFGLLGRPAPRYQGIENVLPPREEADTLIDIYWRYIQPLEPFVDKQRLSESYQTLFAGKPRDHHLSSATGRFLLSTLNAIFALATQLQESLAREVREETSRTYFHRAWALLCPEAIIWEPASLEAVQCMLLLSRYLQCTNHSHQTWMAVGSAVRAAQSLGLDSSQTSAGDSDARSGQRHRLWQCCVFMDRSVSWASGRVSTVAFTTPGVDLTERQGENSSQERAYFNKTLDLYEIANRAVLSHNPDCNALTDSRLCRENDSGVGTVMQLEESIVKWEASLPLDLKLETFQETQADRAESVMYRQAVVLRLRLFHARIVLFKPLLARYCSSSQLPGQGLKDKVFRECAVLCIENAQKMTELVHQEHNSSANLGSIMWWHRVFYLHVAGTVLLASMLQADDLFTQSVAQSWQMAMRALRAHAHLSVSVQQCVATFETLSAKISEAQQLVSVSGAGQASVDPLAGCDEPFSNADFQDIFQDLGIDLDSCLFGVEDMAWTGNYF